MHEPAALKLLLCLTIVTIVTIEMNISRAEHAWTSSSAAPVAGGYWPNAAALDMPLLLPWL
jgi:hypothetical protein